MIAAVARFSLEYFSIIEVIAFSYAISGLFFSTSEIHKLTNPRHRFANRPKKPCDMLAYLLLIDASTTRFTGS
jgi:hypothetical protein